MHIPGHYLDPTTSAAAAAIAGGALIWAALDARKNAAGTSWTRFAAVSAGIFAAQMVNFPVASGTSGHLLGGALAALLLGPGMGVLAVAVVLVVQCLVFGDGAFSALGANILNMAVLGSLVGYGLQKAIAHFTSGTGTHRKRHTLTYALASGIAAWFAVMAAALACSLELAAAGTIEFGKVLPAMLGVHAVIGIGEAVATTIVLAIVWRLQRHQALSLATRWRAAVGLGLALCIALFLAPLACPSPDGLNSVAATYHFGFADQQTDFGLIPNYKVPTVSEAWQPSVAGMIGVLAVFVIAGGLAAGVQRMRRVRTPA